MAKTWKVAVIGRTGKGAYGHGLDVVWLKIPNVEIVAVADEQDAGRAAAAKRLGAKAAYSDYRLMLAKEKPQIVSVADRWLDCHRDMVLACAEHGANIFLEKPICRTLAEADEMVATCERHHVKLAISHQTRYSPRARIVREMIQQGKLGDILELRGRGKEDQRGGGQDLIILGTHIFDLMRFLVGDARWCHAKISQNGQPPRRGDVREGAEQVGPIVGDRLFANFGFDKMIHGSFASHKAAHGAGKRFALQILGSAGSIYIQTGSLPLTLYCDDPAWLPGRGNAKWQEITSNGVGKPETLKDTGLHLGNEWIANDLIAAIETDRQPLGSVYDGRAALEMIHAVYESYRLDRPVDLPLKNRKNPLTMLV